MRSKLAAFLAAVILALSATGAQSQSRDDKLGYYIDGNYLYERCTQDQNRAFCFGFVSAVADTTTFYAEIEALKRGFCPSIHVTNTQKVDIVTNYLRNHPERRHYSAAGITIFALVDAFPCQ